MWHTYTYLSRQVVKGDKEAQEKLPKVIKDNINTSAPKGTRSYSTSARRNVELELSESNGQAVVIPGAKFELPSLPLPPYSNVKHRYDPVVKQITNLMMKHGKLSVAQRVEYLLCFSWRRTALTQTACRICL